jgi:predicted dehydrogenase
VPTAERFRDRWQEVPDNETFDNGFKTQWEQFLLYVAQDDPYTGDLWAGARGVQVAELGLRSSREGRRLEIPELDR